MGVGRGSRLLKQKLHLASEPRNNEFQVTQLQGRMRMASKGACSQLSSPSPVLRLEMGKTVGKEGGVCMEMEGEIAES